MSAESDGSTLSTSSTPTNDNSGHTNGSNPVKARPIDGLDHAPAAGITAGTVTPQARGCTNVNQAFAASPAIGERVPRQPLSQRLAESSHDKPHSDTNKVTALQLNESNGEIQAIASGIDPERSAERTTATARRAFGGPQGERFV